MHNSIIKQVAHCDRNDGSWQNGIAAHLRRTGGSFGRRLFNWDEFVNFMRGLLNSTFKTNPYMERAIMTGITRVSKESVFSDLNNLVVVTTTSEQYADCFGFTEKEVFESIEKYGMSDKKAVVKQWYDGFTFGSLKDI